MARKKGSRANATGRNDLTDRFVRLPHKLLMSRAYRSLGVVARGLMVELTMLDWGGNNGSIYLSLRDATDRLGLSDHHSVSAAFDELTDSGFVRCTKEAHFSVKAADHSRARCWCLTWLAAPCLKKPATNEWQSYDPPAGSRQRKRAERGQRALKRYYRARTSHRLPVVESPAQARLTSAASPEPEVDSTTEKSRNGEKQPLSFEVVSTAHTAVTTIRRPSGEWWRSRPYLRLPDPPSRAFANDNCPEPSGSGL